MAYDQTNSVYPATYSEPSYITRSGASKFPNPWMDIASEYVPRDINTILELCEFLYLTFGTYRTASRRVVRYFLTDIVLEGASDNERKDYTDFLNNDFKLLDQLANIGDDYMTYGNVFISVYFPFDRYLICPDCGLTVRSDKIEYKLDYKLYDIKAKCINPTCEYEGIFKHEDRRSPQKERVKLIRWNPKLIRLRVHPISGKTEYYLEMDPTFTQKIKDGNKFYIEDTPWSMLEACMKGSTKGGPAMFKFKDDAIYHLKDATLAGLPIKGWAIPPIMPNFKLAYYIQILRRYDEAIALDFIMPFRVLFPEGGQGAGGDDPLSMMSMTHFIGHMQNMVEKKRKNITDIQVSPFPIGYKVIGGEAKDLAPKESIALALDELLNAVGFPAELYKGSLSIQAFPVALRLFEKTWGALVSGNNDIISWLLKKLSRHFMWGNVTGTLRSVTLADDIERKALSLQAAAGMDISKQTAYRPLGIDYIEEQRRVVEEQEEIMKLQQEAAERQQASQASTQGQSGGQQIDPNTGMPMAPDPSAGALMEPGATPGDVYEQGKQLAQQLLLQTPPSMRRGELVKIKHSNPTLHAIVTQEMDNMRNEMARQGQAMIMEQSKMASADSLPSPLAVGVLVAEQVCDYNRGDLRKIAMQIKLGREDAKRAFHYVYQKMRGWL